MAPPSTSSSSQPSVGGGGRENGFGIIAQDHIQQQQQQQQLSRTWRPGETVAKKLARGWSDASSSSLLSSGDAPGHGEFSVVPEEPNIEPRAKWQLRVRPPPPVAFNESYAVTSSVLPQSRPRTPLEPPPAPIAEGVCTCDAAVQCSSPA